MLVYLMGIQIYDQVSILISWSNMKLHHAVLLGFGLKESKITLNIVKVGMHSYFPNADLNICLNFNFEKLVKRKTLLCGFAKVGLKGGENILERLEISHVRLSIKWSFKSMSNLHYQKLFKSQTSSCVFARVGIKGGQNSLECCEIWHAWLFI